MTELLWSPSEKRIQSSNMFRFMQTINQNHGYTFDTYESLYAWSIENLNQFWEEMWRYAGIISSQPYSRAIDDDSSMREVKWFEGSRLNFAENLLRFRDDHTALIFRGENEIRKSLSYRDLYAEVTKVQASLAQAGITAGDRVVGFIPNMPEAIIGMLAATSLGAVWSSCSPDFGIKGVLDRFGQTRPKVLFCADGYYFKGKRIETLPKAKAIVEAIPSIEKVIVVPYLDTDMDLTSLSGGIHYSDFLTEDAEDMSFQQLPFDHPLYIMYSSGTTGLPKCMVQSAGGILLHHLKELLLHTDLKRNDTIFYFTTCGWMMWNWLTSSLAAGATLVLYDGNPFHPGPEAMWKMAQEEKISIFGTSAGYIGALKATRIQPASLFDLSQLRTILSTGSPLSKEDFHYVYDEIKSDVQLASISGGSDLNGCFALGNPMGSVYAGELQCRGLGMEVYAYDDEGNSVIDRQGELVCTAPFPSMPIYFWDDADGKKYHSAYFDVFPGIWTHGDYVEITERGGLVMYGRSDATLNPGGVRIGTAEIYRILEQMEELDDSVVVGQKWQDDIRVVLFVKLKEGVELTDQLSQKIRDNIRSSASPRHVPVKILTTPDIPYTLNMKKVELAVQKVIHGLEVKNKDALKNPEALDFFANRKELEES